MPILAGKVEAALANMELILANMVLVIKVDLILDLVKIIYYLNWVDYL